MGLKPNRTGLVPGRAGLVPARGCAQYECESFAVDYSYSTSGRTVTFTDTTAPSASSWLWDFGDGGQSTDQNPVHTYSANGTYSVTLRIDGIPDCKKRQSVVISAATICSFDNIFSDTEFSVDLTGWGDNVSCKICDATVNGTKILRHRRFPTCNWSFGENNWCVISGEGSGIYSVFLTISSNGRLTISVGRTSNDDSTGAFAGTATIVYKRPSIVGSVWPGTVGYTYVSGESDTDPGNGPCQIASPPSVIAVTKL